MSITAWSTTASDNGNRLTSGNFLENQSPSTLNNGARSMMEMVRAWANDLEWFEYGTGSNTVSYNRVSGTSISMAVDVVAQFHVNRRVKIVDGAGATHYGRVTSSSYSSPNTTLVFEFDNSTSLGSGNPTSVKYGVVSATNTSLPNVVPTGTILMTGGSSADSGFLLCDGTAYSKTTYSALFTKIGTVYGSTSTTFNVPDLQAKFPLGKSGSYALGSTGGAFAQTPTGTNSAPTFTGSAGTPSGSISISGGVSNHTLTEAQIPAHRHESGNIYDEGSGSTGNRGFGTTYGRGSTRTGQNVAFGSAHNSLNFSVLSNYVGGGTGHNHAHNITGSFSGSSFTPSGTISTPSFTGSSLNTTNPYIALNYQIKF